MITGQMNNPTPIEYMIVQDLYEEYPELQIKLLTEQVGLQNHIEEIDANRPGLALTGFYKNLMHQRLQLFGRGEYAYLQSLSPDKLKLVNKNFFRYKFPLLVFTHNNLPPKSFLKSAEEAQVPVFSTHLSTHHFLMHYYHVMSDKLAQSTYMHGVLVNVFGVGVLIMGESGIGKSETALALVERGHCFVTDDLVHVRCIADTDLYGMHYSELHYFMEIRGLGIINIRDLYGIQSVMEQCRLEIVIILEEWDKKKDYDRLGLKDDQIEILGVHLPKLIIPVSPSRNIPILIESAAINHRSKLMGKHSARFFVNKIQEKIRKKSKNT